MNARARDIVARGQVVVLCMLLSASTASAGYHIIGDLVWHDANRNGIQDPGEEGVGGVIVNAYNCDSGELIRSTTTSTPENPRATDPWACTMGVGSYTMWFPEPVPFYLEFVLPEDTIYTFTAMDQGGDDALDSDVDPATGLTRCYRWPDHTAGDHETVCTLDAGLVVAKEPCGDCKGKVTQLTLQYNGTADAKIKVVQKEGEIVFDGSVAAGGQFTFAGTDKNGTLGIEISVFVNGLLNTKIHTSCSQPIGPSLVRGDFVVIEGYSKDGGLLCPVVECGCEGKVTQLTLAYLGSSDEPIMVTQKSGNKQLSVFSEDGVNDIVTEEGIFTITGRDKDGTLGTEISLYVGKQLNTRIHTSCSQPIGPGLISGDFLVIEGFSRNGGALCPVRGSEDCGCEGKVAELTLKYNGSQGASVAVIQKKDEIGIFDESVAPGGLFTITGHDKQGTLGTDILVYVNGELNTRIHTSCSQPIGPGLICGDFEVISGRSREGGALCPIGDN